MTTVNVYDKYVYFLFCIRVCASGCDIRRHPGWGGEGCLVGQWNVFKTTVLVNYFLNFKFIKNNNFLKEEI